MLNMGEVKTARRNWSEVLAPNRERISGAELTFVPPNEVDGVKCVYYRKEDVETKMARWKMALIVYVLHSKPPFQ